MPKVRNTRKQAILPRPRVFVGMSGGVDSSVAAYVLKKRGYDVVGIFMRCYNIDGCAERDAEDARRVAEHIGIPFYVWDFEKEYKRDVVKYMLDGYRRGVTPNPDVMCNRQIKFGLFLKKALEAGADYVATGHYVRLVPEFSRFNYQVSNKRRNGLKNFNIRDSLKIGNWKLKIAQDANKDQSYFLWTLTQRELKHCLFPIGDYLKPRVREIARNAGLPTAGKKDSQGICFLGKFSVADFLKAHIKSRRGAVLSATGEKIGEHDGAEFYTIGQRHGLNLGDTRSAIGDKRLVKPLYVAEKNIKTNTLVMAEGDDNPALYKKEVILRDVNFIGSQHSNILKNVGMLEHKKYNSTSLIPADAKASSAAEALKDKLAGRRTNEGNEKIVEIPVMARVRYRQPLSPAILTLSNSRELEKAKLVFDKPVKFVAPGQSAVFYAPKSGSSSAQATKDMEMLGGGVISETT